MLGWVSRACLIHWLKCHRDEQTIEARGQTSVQTENQGGKKRPQHNDIRLPAYCRMSGCGGKKIYLTLVLKWSHCSWFTEKLMFLSLSYYQVNMVIGILVFNKLVSRDGILDKKLKHRAGYDSTSLLVPPLFFFTSCNKYALIFFPLYIWRCRPPFSCCWKGNEA